MSCRKSTTFSTAPWPKMEGSTFIYKKTAQASWNCHWHLPSIGVGVGRAFSQEQRCCRRLVIFFRGSSGTSLVDFSWYTSDAWWSPYLIFSQQNPLRVLESSMMVETKACILSSYNYIANSHCLQSDIMSKLLVCRFLAQRARPL